MPKTTATIDIRALSIIKDKWGAKKQKQNKVIYLHETQH
jgi:hypothetical protein